MDQRLFHSVLAAVGVIALSATDAVPSPSPSPTAAPMPSPSPSATVVPTPSPSPTPFPSVSPSPSPSPSPPERKDELSVTIDYPDGRQKSRVTENGELHALGSFVNQLLTISLAFDPKYAGGPFEIAPMDGGSLEPSQPRVLPGNGKIAFTFRPTHAGLYRLSVISPVAYELQLYVVDPNQTPVPRPNSSAR